MQFSSGQPLVAAVSAAEGTELEVFFATSSLKHLDTARRFCESACAWDVFGVDAPVLAPYPFVRYDARSNSKLLSPFDLAEFATLISFPKETAALVLLLSSLRFSLFCYVSFFFLQSNAIDLNTGITLHALMDPLPKGLPACFFHIGQIRLTLDSDANMVKYLVGWIFFCAFFYIILCHTFFLVQSLLQGDDHVILGNCLPAICQLGNREVDEGLVLPASIEWNRDNMHSSLQVLSLRDEFCCSLLLIVLLLGVDSTVSFAFDHTLAFWGKWQCRSHRLSSIA